MRETLYAPMTLSDDISIKYSPNLKSNARFWKMVQFWVENCPWKLNLMKNYGSSEGFKNVVWKTETCCWNPPKKVKCFHILHIYHLFTLWMLGYVWALLKVKIWKWKYRIHGRDIYFENKVCLRQWHVRKFFLQDFTRQFLVQKSLNFKRLW